VDQDLGFLEEILPSWDKGCSAYSFVSSHFSEMGRIFYISFRTYLGHHFNVKIQNRIIRLFSTKKLYDSTVLRRFAANSISYRQILVNFFFKGRDFPLAANHSILVITRIRIRIWEFFNGIFTIRDGNFS